MPSNILKELINLPIVDDLNETPIAFDSEVEFWTSRYEECKEENKNKPDIQFINPTEIIGWHMSK